MEEIPVSLSQQQLWLVMKRSCPKSFLPATAFSLWEESAQVNGVSDHEGLAYMHLGGKKYTHTSSSPLKWYLYMHILTWKSDSLSLVMWICNVCTDTHWSLHTDAHTQRHMCMQCISHTQMGTTHTHLAGTEALFCLHTSPALYSSSTLPQSRH